MSVKMVPFSEDLLEKAKAFCDQEIGQDYYSLEELGEVLKRSIKNNSNASLVLVDGENVEGLRLSYPAGQWHKGKGNFLSPQLWPYELSLTAYFQSLFISSKYRGKGWGRKLSLKSIEILKQLGAKGAVCHSWVESPDGSSGKYLQSMNFQPICQYPLYWKEVDYRCSRCGKPCLCTAEEMYLDFERMPK